MGKNTTIIIIVALFVAAIAALAVLFIPSTEPASAPAAKLEETPPGPLKTRSKGFAFDTVASSGDLSGGSAAPAATPPPAQATSAIQGGATQVMTAKEATLDTINSAMVTYSAEGVPVLERYLTSSDDEIRTEAIESMKQLGVPEASAALRKAAKKETDPAVRRQMLEAADFVDLPSTTSFPR